MYSTISKFRLFQYDIALLISLLFGEYIRTVQCTLIWIVTSGSRVASGRASSTDADVRQRVAVARSAPTAPTSSQAQGQSQSQSRIGPPAPVSGRVGAGALSGMSMEQQQQRKNRILAQFGVSPTFPLRRAAGAVPGAAARFQKQRSNSLDEEDLLDDDMADFIDDSEQAPLDGDEDLSNVLKDVFGYDRSK